MYVRILVLCSIALAACSDWTLSGGEKVPDEVAVDSDVDTDKPRKPRKPRDTDLPPDTDVPQDSAPPVDESPPGPVDPPVADAGPDRAIAPLRFITLDGRNSYDPGGYTPLVYRWAFTRRPPGSTAALLLQQNKAQPRFFVDIAGTYELKLEVRNSAGVWDPTPDRMQIVATPSERFYVQLTWNSAADLDLHVLRPGAQLFDSPGDCNYCNKNPNWFTGSPDDDASLDWDVINGYGPETTTIEQPATSTYTVAVHYYGVGGSPSCGGSCPPSVAELKFYVDGLLVDTMTRTMNSQGQVWTAATVDWPAATITHVDTMTTTNHTGCR